jgi:hypothetical protein
VHVGRDKIPAITEESLPFSRFRPLLRTALLLLFLGAACRTAAADDGTGQSAQPPSNKVTLAYYDFSSGTGGVDLNLRHTFKSMTAWVGHYHEDDGFAQTRVGYEYDYRSRWLTLVPSVQAATHDFVGATIYAEAGARLFAIAGVGRTNLRPYWNLGFDPNDYLQFGAGYRDSSGSVVSVYAIHDDRLDTGQTNTHFTVRRYLPAEWRLTVDAVNERGRSDTGIEIRSWSVTVDVDWRRWFVRVAEDPHVNYTADHQLRIAGGWRF